MATMATMKRYTLSNFDSLINNGFKCELSSEVLEIIQKLADQVGAPEYIKTPQFIRKEGGHYGRRNRRRNKKVTQLSDEAWEEIRNFEATKRVEKEGIDKSINTVRKAINKISDKTYETVKETIFTEMDNIMNTGIEVDGEDMTKLINTIYKIASQNGFYSELYAQMYAEIVSYSEGKYSFVKKPLVDDVKGFITQLNTISYVSPEEDYDQFCKNNKDNTKRRAISVFFVNAIKHGLVEIDDIVEIIEEIQDKITINLDEDGQSEIIDELSEMVGGMVPLFLTVMKQLEANSDGEYEEYQDVQRTIIGNIETISKMKSKEHSSLSNKTVFKHMDIIDCDELQETIERLG